MVFYCHDMHLLIHFNKIFSEVKTMIYDSFSNPCSLQRLRTGILTMLLCTLCACQSKHISIKQVDNLEEVPINRIALVPFIIDPMITTDSPEKAQRGAETLTRLVERELAPYYSLIPQDEVNALLDSIPSSEATQRATTLGKRFAIDAVVMGSLTRYFIREGSRYAATTPASVAFEVYLLKSTNGELLWSGRFDKTQKPLSEDLGNLSAFIRGEWRWLTTDELMEQGVIQVLDVFPGMRQKKRQRKSTTIGSS